MSSLPDVLSLVTIRSYDLALETASAARLSGTPVTTQEPALRTRNKTDPISGSAPTTSAFLIAKGRVSVLGAQVIDFPTFSGLFPDSCSNRLAGNDDLYTPVLLSANRCVIRGYRIGLTHSGRGDIFR